MKYSTYFCIRRLSGVVGYRLRAPQTQTGLYGVKDNFPQHKQRIWRSQRGSAKFWHTTLRIITILMVPFFTMSILLPSILDAYNASCFMHDDRFDSHGNATHNAAVWTTELSEAVFPGICHSHNDYWRPHPLFSGLSVGCASVEADVWLSPDGEDILVGHDKRSLAPSRTLRSLYIDLLLEVLNRVNLRSTDDSTGQAHGVFSTEPNTTLILFIDVKDDPAKTWPLVLQQLGPLRDKRYLSRHDRTMNTNQSFWNGPITIVGIGNIVKRRDFRNASEYENEFFTASAPFRKAIGSILTGFSKKQLETLRKQIQIARDRKLKSRLWGLPSWPISQRDYVWETLTREGIDLLNANDIASAATRHWESNYARGTAWVCATISFLFLYTLGLLWYITKFGDTSS
ncbi:uncharacterized protein B0J16DRAFT_360555 [Fusarium flagelliforme]|uniref:uncharacterized protein n=1 Tax=Fusarium flagelliforme TaxID=2675880 RepID=UPI001E8EDA61|nr:uncharacterized protein B0J16DRAFT_360555 [Fusarium flagelliforme]KAH7198948.1 hypothetical protein B0J16DRAFT_360555 [Fusarium flagelliforme]